MIRDAVASGETVDIALQKACEMLGVEAADVKFDILQMPTKKTFGLFGGSPAKVRVYIEEEEVIDDPAQDAADYLQSLFLAMQVDDVTIEIQRNETGAALKLVGGDIGFIIGHRGETLDALQYLASLVANHVENSYYRITLDIGNYRAKRMETLQSLGRKMAQKAVRNGRNQVLEPMNPYERRIIHTAVQEVEGAKSWSEGKDLTRHVVIGPVDGERYQRRDNRYRGNNKRNFDPKARQTGRQGGQNQNQRKPVRPKQEQRDVSPKRDDPSVPIYGKFEKKQ